jgi:hypothetical protein
MICLNSPRNNQQNATKPHKIQHYFECVVIFSWHHLYFRILKSETLCFRILKSENVNFRILKSEILCFQILKSENVCCLILKSEIRLLPYFKIQKTQNKISAFKIGENPNSCFEFPKRNAVLIQTSRIIRRNIIP